MRRFCLLLRSLGAVLFGLPFVLKLVKDWDATGRPLPESVSWFCLGGAVLAGASFLLEEAPKTHGRQHAADDRPETGDVQDGRL